MKTTKFSAKSFIAGVVVTAIILSAGTAIASTQRNITVIFDNIRLVVNGQPVTPRDAQGNIVEPFIFEGSTYLPVRAVGEALGMPVSWDGVTRTVYVGTRPGGMSFWDAVPPFEQIQVNPPAAGATMAGNPIDSVTSREFGDRRGVTVNEPWSRHNLNGQYRTLRATIGRVDGTGRSGTTLIFNGDGRVLAQFDIGVDDLPRDISVDLTGVLQLTISTTRLTGIGSTAVFVVSNAFIE